ncbi:MAG: hypothetical protein GXP03_12190 [Alphaproteobacteria bacterium]|nr:hypothetical protein [Alphaproteobacteria bacterium]
MTRIITALLLVSFVAACGQSRLNPFNWFGRDKETRNAQNVEIVDPRGLVGEIIKLKVDRLPGGAIINAFGLPPTQGYWEAELVPLNDEFPDKGVLTYEFRLLPPGTRTDVGTKVSREVVVARFVSDQQLVGVRRIRVIADANSRTVRR